MKTILVDAVGCFVVETPSGYAVFSEMRDLLDALPNEKIIVTGANDEQFRKFGLDNMPYKVFTLKHDPEKTDPAYFQELLSQFGLSAGEVVYLEHNPEAVQSASSVGITSYHYPEKEKDLVALKAFLDKNL